MSHSYWQRGEDSPGFTSTDRGFRSASGLCPEVGYDVFGHFASGFFPYGDELDTDIAHQQLAKAGAGRNDPRWRWAVVIPQHYTECRQYSVLTSADPSPPVRSHTSFRRGLSPAVRWAVFARDLFTCAYCGRKPPDVSLEVDHKTAVAQGVTDDPNNLITACTPCNRGKGTRGA